MSERIKRAFDNAKKENRSAFVSYITVGHPSIDEFLPAVKALQDNGADVIELGIPYSDPQADGPTIQLANNTALAQHVNLTMIFELVKKARAAECGVFVPFVFMGYINPLLQYGVERAIADARIAGVDGIIVVDLPPEESSTLISSCLKYDVSYIPLVTPTSTPERLSVMAKLATSFIYCVSVTGVTGARDVVAQDLPEFVQRIRKNTSLPLAVGFGVSTRDHVVNISKLAEGVVVGTALIKSMESAEKGKKIDALAALCKTLTNGTKVAPNPLRSAASAAEIEQARKLAVVPIDKRINLGSAAADGKSNENPSNNTDGGNAKYRYGPFGGRFIPETLLAAHEELDIAFEKAIADPAFNQEVDRMRRQYIGGPTMLYYADRLTKKCGGCKIWLKREEMAHTGAHKINNAIGQALLAKRLGKTRIIAETGAGQHGVATATACALLDLECVVYMGAEDCRRQSLNVFRMELLGAKVHPVQSGSKTLKDAINEAMRDWVTNVRTTHYIIGSAVGAYPFPKVVQHFQSVIGKETRQQMMAQAGKLPDVVIACVGGGSNAIGMFHEFIGDKSVKMIGVEAGGVKGISGPHSATMAAGRVGVMHGAMSYLLQDDDGQVIETHSISAGLDYPGVGPEHSFLKFTNRAEYFNVTDGQALDGMKELSRTEGIIPALETSHAVYYAINLAKTLPANQDMVILLSGRGDKDMNTVSAVLGMTTKFD